MFFSKNIEDNLEQATKKNDAALQQLLIRIDALEREAKVLLDELQVTPEQVTTFMANPDNFTPENWDELQEQRKTLEDKLKRDIDNIRNPSKTKKAQADRHVQRHWLFVK